MINISAENPNQILDENFAACEKPGFIDFGFSSQKKKEETQPPSNLHPEPEIKNQPNQEEDQVQQPNTDRHLIQNNIASQANMENPNRIVNTNGCLSFRKTVQTVAYWFLLAAGVLDIINLFYGIFAIQFGFLTLVIGILCIGVCVVTVQQFCSTCSTFAQEKKEIEKEQAEGTLIGDQGFKKASQSLQAFEYSSNKMITAMGLADIGIQAGQPKEDLIEGFAKIVFGLLIFGVLVFLIYYKLKKPAKNLITLEPRPFAPSNPTLELQESPVQSVRAEPMSSKKMSAPKGQLTMKERMALKKQRQAKPQDFKMLQKLEKGAFGDVFIAQEKKIGFVCVIKKMSKQRVRTVKVMEHVLKDIKIQSYLHNKNITFLFGYFHDEQNLYLILQALPDRSLQNAKKKKKQPAEQAPSIVRQAAEDLKDIHEDYAIHRQDLKPKNLFVNEDTVKIGDFECSIYNRDLDLRNTVVGCLQYSSPEQLSQEGYSDKIDSWSQGIRNYELLFGKSHFRNDLIKLAQNKESEPKLSTLSFTLGTSIKDEPKRFIENLREGDPEKKMEKEHHELQREEIVKSVMKIEQK